MVLYSNSDFARALASSAGVMVGTFIFMRLTFKDSLNMAGLTFVVVLMSCIFLTHINGNEVENLQLLVNKRMEEAQMDKEERRSNIYGF
jgi:hypothetical protein